MSKIERFEDLIAWQKARVLTKSIYDVTNQGRLGRDYGLANQIQRASVSIMSNIAEGFERHSRGEFHQFLSIAKASCAELRSELYVALDAGYIDEANFNRLLAQADETGRILGALRATVQKQRDLQRKNSRAG